MLKGSSTPRVKGPPLKSTWSGVHGTCKDRFQNHQTFEQLEPRIYIEIRFLRE
jgi:hypothetical protein